MKTKIVMLSLTITLILSSVWMLSCKKNDPPTPVADSTPIITDKGTPTGDPVTATIGPSGGTIQTSDGNISITIPQDALSSATQISIQPITNNGPSGLGSGYSLLPEGTTFSKPVKLTFHYDSTILNGSNENFLWIVTQANDGSWNAMLNSDLDTISKTVTVESTHFSAWMLGTPFQLEPGNKIVKPGEVVNLKLLYYVRQKTTSGNNTSAQLSANTAEVGDDDLQPLVPIYAQKYGQFKILSWSMNGSTASVSNSSGSLSASGVNATYTAPGTIPKNKMVAVTVNMQLKDIKGKISFLSMNTNFTISDDYLNLKMDGKSYFYNQYLINGTYPPDFTSYSNIICTYSAKHLNIKAAIWTGTSSTLLNIFEIDINNPTVGTKYLTQTEDVLFSINAQKVLYSFSYVTYLPTANGCNINQTIGTVSMKIDNIDLLSPSTNLGKHLIKGSFSGKIFDHDPGECNTAKPHTISGDFSFESN